MEGGPVSLLCRDSEGMLLLQHENLESIFKISQDPNKDVAVVGVIGPSKSGKSFLLNYIMRFLQNGPHGAWMRKRENGVDKPLEGFPWNLKNEEPFGIQAWPTPFAFEYKDDEMIDVYLLEFHTDSSSDGDNYLLTMLAVSMCSLIIFNEFKEIEDTPLRYLIQALEDLSESHPKDCQINPSIAFIVRDFDASGHGPVNGKKYFEKRFFEVMASCGCGNPDNLDKALICHTFTQPDFIESSSPDFNGQQSLLGQRFSEHLKSFIVDAFEHFRLEFKEKRRRNRFNVIKSLKFWTNHINASLIKDRTENPIQTQSREHEQCEVTPMEIDSIDDYDLSTISSLPTEKDGHENQGTNEEIDQFKQCNDASTSPVEVEITHSPKETKSSSREVTFEKHDPITRSKIEDPDQPASTPMKLVRSHSYTGPVTRSRTQAEVDQVNQQNPNGANTLLNAGHMAINYSAVVSNKATKSEPELRSKPEILPPEQQPKPKPRLLPTQSDVNDIMKKYYSGLDNIYFKEYTTDAFKLAESNLLQDLISNLEKKFDVKLEYDDPEVVQILQFINTHAYKIEVELKINHERLAEKCENTIQKYIVVYRSAVLKTLREFASNPFSINWQVDGIQKILSDAKSAVLGLCVDFKGKYSKKFADGTNMELKRINEGARKVFSLLRKFRADFEKYFDLFICPEDAKLMEKLHTEFAKAISNFENAKESDVEQFEILEFKSILELGLKRLCENFSQRTAKIRPQEEEVRQFAFDIIKSNYTKEMKYFLKRVHQRTELEEFHKTLSKESLNYFKDVCKYDTISTRKDWVAELKLHFATTLPNFIKENKMKLDTNLKLLLKSIRESKSKYLSKMEEDIKKAGMEKIRDNHWLSRKHNEIKNAVLGIHRIEVRNNHLAENLDDGGDNLEKQLGLAFEDVKLEYNEKLEAESKRRFQLENDKRERRENIQREERQRHELMKREKEKAAAASSSLSTTQLNVSHTSSPHCSRSTSASSSSKQSNAASRPSFSSNTVLSTQKKSIAPTDKTQNGKPVFLGIELGHKFVRAGIYNVDAKRFEIVQFGDLAHLENQTWLPCIVGFNPNGTVSIGRGADASPAKSEFQNLIDRILNSDTNNRMLMESHHLSTTVKFQLRIDEILGIILRHVKEMAETYLGLTFSGAAITIPLWYNMNLRQITKDAAAFGGFEFVHLISEASAAAIGWRKQNIENILTFDDGINLLVAVKSDIYFDAALFNLKPDEVAMFSTSGNFHFDREKSSSMLIRVYSRITSARKAFMNWLNPHEEKDRCHYILKEAIGLKDVHHCIIVQSTGYLGHLDIKSSLLKLCETGDFIFEGIMLYAKSCETKKMTLKEVLTYPFSVEKSFPGTSRVVGRRNHYLMSNGKTNLTSSHGYVPNCEEKFDIFEEGIGSERGNCIATFTTKFANPGKTLCLHYLVSSEGILLEIKAKVQHHEPTFTNSQFHFHLPDVTMLEQSKESVHAMYVQSDCCPIGFGMSKMDEALDIMNQMAEAVHKALKNNLSILPMIKDAILKEVDKAVLGVGKNQNRTLEDIETAVEKIRKYHAQYVKK